MKKVIVRSNAMKGMLDDDYILYEDGEVVHEYDRHTYSGGQNRRKSYKPEDLAQDIKNRILAAASDENKALAKKLLKIEG